MNSQPILTADEIVVKYGAVTAVKGVGLCVNEGEIVTVLGTNGAGKSSLLKSLVGLTPTHSGTATFLGQDITGARTENIVRMGLTLTP